MKSLRVGLTCLYFLTPTFGMAQSDLSPSPISKIMIPSGFDDNDNVEIIMMGYHRSTCYKVGPTSSKVDVINKSIVVTAESYTYPSFFCADVLSPFIQTAKVGFLAPGEYTVRLAHDESIKTTISVKRRTTESPDDFLYAPIEDARIESDQLTRKQALVVEGTFPILTHGCWRIRELRVSQDQDDMVVVQPIAEIVDGQACANRPSLNFKMSQALAKPIYGDGLLHVRVLSGNSLNRFLNFESR